MAISAVTNAFSQYAQNVTGTTAGAPAGAATTAAASSSLQEASETASQTAKEAAHGDRVAKAKLAHTQAQQQQQQQASSPVAPSEVGKGKLVDKAA